MAFFKGIFQIVNSKDLRDVKYIFQLDDGNLKFSSTRQVGFGLNSNVKLLS